MRAETIREVEQFLYREARLLDERRFHEWLELLTDDVRYAMFACTNAYPVASRALAILDDRRYAEAERGLEGEVAILDETKDSLRHRIARLDTGMAWAEDPPSRTRHLITNIEVYAGDTAAECLVYANYVVYRNRGQTEHDFYVGRREDVLRQGNGAWQIARRKVMLDQNVLLAKNVSIFF